MTTIEYKAYKLYKTSSPPDKKELENTFGNNFFKKKITEIIESIDDIYSYLGLIRDNEIPFKNPITKQQRSINATFDIQNISLVLNEGWIENWLDHNQSKYYLYFKKKELSGWLVEDYNYNNYNAKLSFSYYFTIKQII